MMMILINDDDNDHSHVILPGVPDSSKEECLSGVDESDDHEEDDGGCHVSHCHVLSRYPLSLSRATCHAV